MVQRSHAGKTGNAGQRRQGLRGDRRLAVIDAAAPMFRQIQVRQYDCHLSHARYRTHMKFTLDSRSDINLIRGYGPGEVRVAEVVQRAPCIVTASRLILDWPVRDFAALTAADLEPIFTLGADVVLLGTGPRQIFPGPPSGRYSWHARWDLK